MPISLSIYQITLTVTTAGGSRWVNNCQLKQAVPSRRI